ncbi:D-cysteine desulfhydrase [Luteibacter rhizovicinus DSM 16549]|uniref:D-cysteine desulfhydrase n=1 Tax=Luteibacter rhizovicinus DSM 16549 TaxID=1440763 RepID=A0A0G9HB78_9GAMM|nr:D-cysteine desulfhydrase family protein [Luteibacter rhizovicinus]APG04006.1 D-cysteine desulfhydrase [Luteibacter rhizovicinus DSM 16549]KLD66494.1 cytochrome C biogenesis protein CcmE [Luteibacter rhizovicinus DSM 16549]
MSYDALDALDRLPRIPLLDTVTAVHRLERVEERLGLARRGIRLSIKRDDVMALGGGGNKLRKLEYHLGHARDIGADTIITVGGVQSNHARLTAAAAARHGFACEMLLARMVPKDGDDYEKNGNVLLDALFGAKVTLLPRGENALVHATARAEALQAGGHVVVILPTGGSTPRGALGYARCAREIAQQEDALDLRFDRIIVPNGSSGTHAGLVAGFAALGRQPERVMAYSVLAARDAAATTTLGLARDALALLGSQAELSDAHVRIDGAQLGDGYGVPTVAMKDALRLMASAEGILLDPVYSGKAFAGLVQSLRDGTVRDGEHVLFIATGGQPGLYAYREDLVG